jgi:beta-lactamase regulating signal transducer with metallopeptidase domain
MLVYLLKMIACSAAFYGLYVLLFKNEKMFVFNRFYLLAALIVSYIIPFITFTVYVTVDDSYIINSVGQPIKEQYSWNGYAMIVLTTISILGSLVLSVRFAKNLMHLKRIAGRSHKRVVFKGVKIALLREPVVPYSFMNTIFLNNDEYRDQRIEKEVLEHELAHVRQRHSWDILFVELLQVFCWFNPIIYLYKRSIKINHELLADAAVVKELDNMRSYQHLLLQRAGAQPSQALGSSFHFFITKKRIIMLQKKANPVIAGLKATLCLPLLGLMVFMFSERIYAQAPPPPPKASLPGKVSKGKPSDVEVFIVETRNGKDSRAVIKYKNGKEVSGDVSTPENKMAFEKKYGIELPPPPPPPPPPARKRKMAPPPPPPPPTVTKIEAPLPQALTPVSPKKKISAELLTQPRLAKVEKMAPLTSILPPTPPKENKVAATAVTPVESLSAELVAHILQHVEHH